MELFLFFIQDKHCLIMFFSQMSFMLIPQTCTRRMYAHYHIIRKQFGETWGSSPRIRHTWEQNALYKLWCMIFFFCPPKINVQKNCIYYFLNPSRPRKECFYNVLLMKACSYGFWKIETANAEGAEATREYETAEKKNGTFFYRLNVIFYVT